MNPTTLRHNIHLHTYFREKLLEAFPEADDETIRDTLEGLTTLNELIAEIIRSALIDEALQNALRFRLHDMKERLGRLEARSAKKRELAVEAMEEAGLRKLEQPDFTASTRSARLRYWSRPRIKFLKLTGCPSRRSWTARPCLAASSEVNRSAASRCPIPNRCSV